MAAKYSSTLTAQIARYLKADAVSLFGISRWFDWLPRMNYFNNTTQALITPPHKKIRQEARGNVGGSRSKQAYEVENLQNSSH